MMLGNRRAAAPIGLVALLLVISMLATSCFSGQPKGQVTVFVAAPLSGFQANGGQTVVGGVRLLAEQLNRNKGLLGYQINVVALDDESDSDVAVDVAQTVVEAVERGDRVLGVVGHYNSGQTLAAMEVYQTLPIIVITLTASEVSLTRRGYSNFFRINADNSVQAKVGASYLTDALGARKVAVLYNDDPYGIDLGTLVASELESLGAEVVFSQQVQVEQGRLRSAASHLPEQTVSTTPDTRWNAPTCEPNWSRQAMT